MNTATKVAGIGILAFLGYKFFTKKDPQTTVLGQDFITPSFPDDSVQVVKPLKGFTASQNELDI